MKLSFLGQSYEASNSAVDSVETHERLNFLGQHYNRKEYTVANRSEAPRTLNFMGRQYTR